MAIRSTRSPTCPTLPKAKPRSCVPSARRDSTSSRASPRMAGTPFPRRSTLVWFALAIGAGIALRLDQLASQLLLEDEWHAVYRVVHDTPLAIFLDFGHSDSSIPLTLLYLGEAHAFGLSELAMRWPMIAAGIATLVL